MPKIGKGGPLGYLKIKFVAKYPILLDIKKFSTKFQSRKKIERPLKNIPLVSLSFANARKRFWQKQGLEPVTIGFPLNRLVEVTIY